jgi:hypothetical protein
MNYVRVDIDLDDIYNEMDRNDKRIMSEWLHDDGVLEVHPNPEIRKMFRGDEESNGERELRDQLSKIWNSYHLLTNGEEELIKQISNRIP